MMTKCHAGSGFDPGMEKMEVVKESERSVWISQGSPENRTNMILVYLKWQLGHVILWAKKSCNLLSASQRTKKAGGIIELEAEDLKWQSQETKSAYVWGQEKIDVLAESRSTPTLLYLFLSGPSMDWMLPTHVDEGKLLSSVYWFKCWSLSEIPCGTHPGKNVLPATWASFNEPSHRIKPRAHLIVLCQC